MSNVLPEGGYQFFSVLTTTDAYRGIRKNRFDKALALETKES
jgi:hypothetical protein